MFNWCITIIRLGVSFSETMIDLVVFELQTDKQTGFKTRSILCMPIRNAQGRVIGVSQLVNKKDRTPFNKNDENLFEVSIKWYTTGVAKKLIKLHTSKRDHWIELWLSSIVSFFKWKLLLKERICSQRERILSFKISSLWKENHYLYIRRGPFNVNNFHYAHA